MLRSWVAWVGYSRAAVKGERKRYERNREYCRDGRAEVSWGGGASGHRRTGSDGHARCGGTLFWENITVRRHERPLPVPFEVRRWFRSKLCYPSTRSMLTACSPAFYCSFRSLDLSLPFLALSMDGFRAMRLSPRAARSATVNRTTDLRGCRQRGRPFLPFPPGGPKG